MLPTRAARAASTLVPLTLSQASAQLIPPIPLYRRLLRAHRSLPNEFRSMGDLYVKSEFRLTRKADNPVHVIAFLTQWKSYLDAIEAESKSGAPFRGRKLDAGMLEALSDEQVGQLYTLMHATDDVWKSPAELEQGAQDAEAKAAKKDE